ncbi:hypothetical protein D3C84_801910 [compost metagenome]
MSAGTISRRFATRGSASSRKVTAVANMQAVAGTLNRLLEYILLLAILNGVVVGSQLRINISLTNRSASPRIERKMLGVDIMLGQLVPI